jgi:hypothetical protein
MFTELRESEMFEKVNRYTNFSLKCCLNCTDRPVLQNLDLAVLKPERKVWVGRSPLLSPQCLNSVASIGIYNDFFRIFSKNVRIS